MKPQGNNDNIVIYTRNSNSWLLFGGLVEYQKIMSVFHL